MKDLKPFAILLALAAAAGTAFGFTEYPGLAFFVTVAAHIAAQKLFSKVGNDFNLGALYFTLFCLAAGVALSGWGNSILVAAFMSMGLAGALRYVLFRQLGYSGFPILEPGLIGIAWLLWIVGALQAGNWQAWTWPGLYFAFITFMMFGSIWGNHTTARLGRAVGAWVGKAAPAFELKNHRGETVSLDQFKGRQHTLLIFVRGDWCPTCHIMLRTYEKFRDRFKQKNIMMLGIGPDPVGVNRAMVEKLGLDYHMLSDDQMAVAAAYGIHTKERPADMIDDRGIALPASFLVDKEGVVRYTSRPDKVGEFLDPKTIFPVVESLA